VRFPLSATAAHNSEDLNVVTSLEVPEGVSEALAGKAGGFRPLRRVCRSPINDPVTKSPLPAMTAPRALTKSSKCNGQKN